jgi:hypothetical protein
LKIEIINPLKIPNWNDQIAQLPGATIFHTANWARVLVESYNYRPAYFTAFKDGQIAGCIPTMDINSLFTGRRGVALPFTDECHPLGTDAVLFEQLWEKAVFFARQKSWRHIELRGRHDRLGKAPAFCTFVVHEIELNGCGQTLLNQFRDSTRRNIYKAEKYDVQVYRLRSLDAVRHFYRLNCITRQSHGLPPQPYAFFKALHQHLIAKNMGFVQLALSSSKTIAGAIFFHFNRKLIFKYGASDTNYQSLRANNLILWEAIQWGLQNGYTRFNLGRTDPEHHGLLQFKKGWGGKMNLLNYYRYEPEAARYIPGPTKLKTFYAVLQKLPMPLLKLTGRLLYRHIG